MQNPSVLTTRATRKTTRFRQRDAKCNAAGAMHRVAWALQTAKGTGQKCEKPWKNQGFTAERTGFEQVPEFKGIQLISLPRDAKNDARRSQGLETTRSTDHRFVALTPRRTFLQGHELGDAPKLRGHRIPFPGSFSESHQNP